MLYCIGDTHAFIWHLFDDSRLSARARESFTFAAQHGLNVGVSSMTLVEIVYLEEKDRIPANTLENALAVMAEPKGELIEIPLDSAVVFCMRDLSRQQVPDMPDRIIAATGLHYNVPVISKDARIRAANLLTIWCKHRNREPSDP